MKEAAYASIANAKYLGEKKKFSFDTYINIHQEAYQDLRQHDEVIPEDKRVRDLLTAIKDQTFNAAKQTTMAIQDLRTDFATAVADVVTTIQMNVALVPDNRNISETNTGHGRGNATNGGRGQGRGGCGGRAGRGGRGRGGNVYLGTYSPAQLWALSAEDKKKVTDGRKHSAEQSQQSQAGLQISQVVIGQQQELDEQSAITMGMATINNQQRAHAKSAGSVMTRRRLMAIVSRARYALQSRSIMSITHDDIGVSSMCELDSHADTCVAGPNCKIIEYSG